MKIFKDAIKEVKNVPKSVWVAAAILPGGFTAIAAYLTIKGAYKSLRKVKND